MDSAGESRMCRWSGMTTKPCSRNRPPPPVTEHGVDQKFSIRRALEDAAAFKSNGCEGVGLRIEAHCGPAGLKSGSVVMASIHLG